MSEVVLINVTGRDRPGLTARLTDVLANYDIPVLDIDQSVTHHCLAAAGNSDINSICSGSSVDSNFSATILANQSSQK